MELPFQGIYHLLSSLPVWATALILIIFMVAVIPVGRWLLEGKWYQVSWSAFPGDFFLVIIALIGANILHHGSAYIPYYLGHTLWLQWVIYLGALSVCCNVCILTLDARDGQLMDIYHDAVVVPIFVSLAIFLLPVIFINGSSMEFNNTLVLLSSWFILLVFDLKQGRLPQRKFIREHGGSFEGDEPEQARGFLFSVQKR